MDFEAISQFLIVGQAVSITTRNGDEYQGVICALTAGSFALELTDGSRTFVSLDQIDLVKTHPPVAQNLGQDTRDPDLPLGEEADSVPKNNPNGSDEDSRASQSTPNDRTSPAPTIATTKAAAAGSGPGRDSHSSGNSATSQAELTVSTGDHADPHSPPSSHPLYVKPSVASLDDIKALQIQGSISPTWTVDALPRTRQIIAAAESAFQYAVKVQELDPRFGRIQNVVSRAYTALLSEPTNPCLFRLLGELELIHGRPERARPYLVNGAELGADPASWRLLIQASADMNDADGVVYAGLRLLRLGGIDAFGALWESWVESLRSRGQFGQLASLLLSSSITPADRHRLKPIVADVPPSTPLERPRGLSALPVRQVPQNPSPRPAANKPKQPAARQTATARIVAPRVRQDGASDPYRRAHDIEHRGGDLEEAKALYREAIRLGEKVESRVKDLAWLVRRTEGPVAALRVVEQEYPGALKPSDATDNILIDFLYGAGRYSEALETISRQLARSTISYSRRLVLEHQQATVKLRLGEDSVAEWRHIAEITNEAFARRGLALAYLVRGDAEDLPAAEMIIAEDEDPRASDIRARLELAKLGQAELSEELDFDTLLERTAPSLTPPLIEYVTRNYSNQATNLIEQRQRERRTVHPLDAARLAENAENLRGRQRENSADGYISAAVIVRDKLHRQGHDERANDEFRIYLCQGLVALADVMLDREHPDSARDLYAAALSVAESLQEAEAVLDVKFAFARYFLSLDGRRALGKARGDLAEVSLDNTLVRNLKNAWDSHGSEVFDLLMRLFAVSSYAGSQVLEAISQEAALKESATEFLSQRGVTDPEGGSAAWTQAAREWWAGERTLVREFLSLQPTELSEEALQSGIAVLSTLERRAPLWSAPYIGSLALAYRELRRSLYERAFEERETCFRRTLERSDAVLEEIQLAPTQLAVESLVPVAERLKIVAQTAMMDLYSDYPPAPLITPALETIGMDERGRAVLQVKIANGAGSAPLESPELHIGNDPATYNCSEPVVTLASAIRGGEYHIEMIKLDVTARGKAEGAFSVPLVLRFRARGSGEQRSLEVTLPVQLGLSGEFKEIENPYHEGSLGRPVGRAEMFYGREDILERIAQRLTAADRGGTGFAIYGQKRAGKSSIRIHLSHRLALIPNLVVVDMGNVGTLAPAGEDRTGQVLSSLAWQIVKRANRELSKLGLGTIGGDSDVREFLFTSPTPVVDCLDLFDEYLNEDSSDANPRFVLLFDEFQYFELWIRRGLLDPSFMQSLKAMIERGVFDIVAVGQDALDRLIAAHPNVFGVFGRERVTYLTEGSARQLIDEPIRVGGKDGDSRFREGALDRILELTGGSPFYIQKFCFELVRHMNAHHAPFVTEADVEMVTQSFIAMLDQNDFDNLETSGYLEEEEGYRGSDAIRKDYYRDALIALGIATREGPAGLERVKAYYKGPDDVGAVLQDLVERDVVRKEAGRYRIVVRLYRDWLIFHHFGATYVGED